ncbi:MAG TPA: DUF2480 family protein [Saprospiraceae bacterium]|nr:DUF2480 family protein [Saprospiraceae bacterium]
MNDQIGTLVNRVEQSGLVTIYPEKYLPEQEVVEFDLKPFLFMELILKELDFRDSLKKMDWTIYSKKNVAVICSVDVIIPTWAYMLVSSYVQQNQGNAYFGTKEEVVRHLISQKIEALDVEIWRDKKLVIKGCSDIPIPASAYMDLMKKLQDVASSIMYGEPCSTVPVFKRKLNAEKT